MKVNCYYSVIFPHQASVFLQQSFLSFALQPPHRSNIQVDTSEEETCFILQKISPVVHIFADDYLPEVML